MMIKQDVVDKPIKGKTYNLYGSATGTAQYYNAIRTLADICMQDCPDILKLLTLIQGASRKKRFLKQQIRGTANRSPISLILSVSRSMLATYTEDVATHLKSASLSKLKDSILLTTEEQYHLYMLEIELVNRLYAESFKQCKTKLAFLPHCLRDLEARCRAKPELGDIDHTCKRCSRKCFINHTSTLLQQYNIKPYIWMDADLSNIFSTMKKEGYRHGVLGIACVPELVDGIRLCLRHNIPVVGIPLNANRCARWMGKFHTTSVNIEELEKLIS